MGSIGDPLTLIVPGFGTTGPTYAAQVDAFLEECRTRLSAKVPFSAVNFGSDLPLNGQNVLNAGYITLNNTGSTPGASPVNRLTAFSGDLWYVSPGGAIQITTGPLLNAAAIGGITGDYGGVSPAQFRYDSVTTRYTAFANFGTNSLAFLRAAAFDVAGTGSANARISFAGSVSQTYTLPVAAPAATSGLYMTSTGAVVTASALTKVFSYSAFGAVYQSGTTPGGNVFSTSGGMTVTNTDQIAKPIDGLPRGLVMTSVEINVVPNNVSGTTVTFVVVKVDASGTVSNLGSATQSITTRQNIAIGISETVGTSCTYYVRGSTSSAINATWHGFQVTGTLAV